MDHRPFSEDASSSLTLNDADRRRQVLEALVARAAEAERRERDARAAAAADRLAMPIWKRDEMARRQREDMLQRSRAEADSTDVDGCSFQPEINPRSKAMPTRKHVSGHRRLPMLLALDTLPLTSPAPLLASHSFSTSRLQR